MNTSPLTLPDLSDDGLQAMAERFVDALLSSADVDVIGAVHWWDRAKTALQTGAASSTSWAQCVSTAARKLQIETLSAESSAAVADLGRVLAVPIVFQRWARLAARDALYTVAIVRNQREERKAARKAAKQAPVPAAVPAGPPTLDLPNF